MSVTRKPSSSIRSRNPLVIIELDLNLLIIVAIILGYLLMILVTSIVMFRCWPVEMKDGNYFIPGLLWPLTWTFLFFYHLIVRPFHAMVLFFGSRK